MARTGSFLSEERRVNSTRGASMFGHGKPNDQLFTLRDDVEALLQDLIADEADHNIAAMWAGEQLNGLLVSSSKVARLFDEDRALFETLALLTDLGPRLVPLEVKPGTFERMLKRLRESTPQLSTPGRG